MSKVPAIITRWTRSVSVDAAFRPTATANEDGACNHNTNCTFKREVLNLRLRLGAWFRVIQLIEQHNPELEPIRRTACRELAHGRIL
jgi:hypothetical protein